VNPVASAERYMDKEIAEARPLTAHMLATGFAVLDLDGWAADVRVRAQALLDAGPPADPERDLRIRYGAATLFEDATDVVERDPALAQLLLCEALVAMLDYSALAAGRFLASSDLAERVGLAGEIADRTIGTRGFFEWESPEAPLESGDS